MPAAMCAETALDRPSDDAIVHVSRSSSAPHPPTPLPGDRRRAVARRIDGGGARGLAHVGVLAALERAGVPIDAIAGTSMGALVGGLYAAGYSAGQLDSIARRLDWPTLFSDATDRGALGPFERSAANPTLLTLPMRHGRIGLPSGVIAGQHMAELFAELTWPVQQV